MIILPEITASEKPWNSATTLYIARKLDEIARGRRLQVLDMGCGDGRSIALLSSYGHILYGYDLPDKADALRTNLEPIFGEEFASRIHFMEDEQHIPFDARQFDIVYANQVFEHVRFLDQMMSECVRVLKPNGTLVMLFPLATYLIEGHVLVPFAHWLPPGRIRRFYLRLLMTFGIGRRKPGQSAADAAKQWDDFLRLYTFYRFMNEMEALFDYYFEEWHVDTGSYVQGKADLLRANSSATWRAAGRVLERLNSHVLTGLVTYGFNAVFCAQRPKSIDRRTRVLPWRL